MTTISVSHLKKYYKVFRRSAGLLPTISSLFKRETTEVKAVDDVSFEIEEGELVGFIGPNGAGKTTTLKCLSGLLYPSEGMISVLGFNPYERKKEFLTKISLIMGQKNQLWWDLPAMDTFLLNKEIYEMEKGDFEESLDELASLLEVGELLTTPVRQLSLGQRMKMELIATLLHKPKVLFLDEPTIGLDVVMQKKMRDFIAEYNERYSSTILLTSHYMADVKQLCSRLIIIDHGKIIYDGKLSKLVEQYAGSKILQIVFAEAVTREELSKFGNIKVFEPPRVVLKIPRKQTKSVATSILSKFQVEDLTIEEPEIEEIIRIVFSKKRQ